MPEGRNRRIVVYGHPALRRRAGAVSTFTPELAQVFADIKETMLQQDGLGLAANQIGEAVAVFSINPRAAGVDRDPCCIINPRVVRTGGSVEDEEGCLSLPGLYEVIARPSMVLVAGFDENGAPVEIEGEGLLARALLHEVDHLNGVLFIDHLSPTRRRLLNARLSEFEELERRACE